MKKKVWETQKGYYMTCPDIVWILDENWELMWGNFSENPDDILKLMNLPKDSWMNDEKEICWKNRTFNASLLCNKQEQCRIIRLKETKPLRQIPIDYNILKWGIDSIMDDMSYFYDFFQKNQLTEPVSRLNQAVLHGQCIQRTVYLWKLQKDILNSDEIKENISVIKELDKLKAEIQKAFGKETKVELDLLGSDFEKAPKNKLPRVRLCEDERLFPAAVLSALVLCCPNPGQNQKIQIKFTKQGDLAKLFLHVTELPKVRCDYEKQPDPNRFGAPEAEKSLLNLFCERHKGMWEIFKENTKSGNSKYSCRIYFEVNNDVPRIMCSFRNQVKEVIPYEINAVMLSRLCYQEIFREKRRK